MQRRKIVILIFLILLGVLPFIWKDQEADNTQKKLTPSASDSISINKKDQLKKSRVKSTQESTEESQNRNSMLIGNDEPTNMAKKLIQENLNCSGIHLNGDSVEQALSQSFNAHNAIKEEHWTNYYGTKSDGQKLVLRYMKTENLNNLEVEEIALFEEDEEGYLDKIKTFTNSQKMSPKSLLGTEIESTLKTFTYNKKDSSESGTFTEIDGVIDEFKLYGPRGAFECEKSETESYKCHCLR